MFNIYYCCLSTKLLVLAFIGLYLYPSKEGNRQITLASDQIPRQPFLPLGLEVRGAEAGYVFSWKKKKKEAWQLPKGLTAHFFTHVAAA